MPPELIDISRTISSDAAVWPGDEPLRHSPLTNIGNGCPCQTTKLDGWSTHFLTHVDAPAHFIVGAPTLDQLPLARFMIEVTVVEIPSDTVCVEEKHITPLTISAHSGVLFKTKNSDISTEAPFSDNFVFISPQAARKLVEKQAKLVGIDYLSVDPFNSTDFPAHYEFLGNDVLILEGIQLKNVAAGLYDLYALPLKIRDADGSPVRAVLVKK